MSDWNLQTGTTATKKWTRSWRQEFFTDLGSDFRVVLHMEEVITLESGEVIHTPLPQVVRVMSSISSDPDAVQMATLMTNLAKKWLDEDAANATPIPTPLPVPPVAEPPA